MDGLLEKDYTKKTMAENSSLREQSQLKWRKQDAKRECFPQAKGLSKQHILKLLQDKVTQRSRGGIDQFRKIYKLFAKAENISCEDFASTLSNQFGLNLAPGQARTLFSHFDKTGSGTISLAQFMSELLPRDYQDALSGENFEGRSWYVQAEEREMRRKQRELKDRRDEFMWGLDDEGTSSKKKQVQDQTRNKRKKWAANHRLEMSEIIGHGFMENQQKLKLKQKLKQQNQKQKQLRSTSSLPVLPEHSSNSSSHTIHSGMKTQGQNGCDYMNSSSKSRYSNSSKQIRQQATDSISISLPSLPIPKQQQQQQQHRANHMGGNNRSKSIRTGRDFETSIQTCRQKMSTHTGRSRSSGVAARKRKQLLNEIRMLKNAVNAR